ncbi:hemin uptake protein HemP [Phreatobacter cathodiphilus]|uniref:Hemin uptake protein HemP n=2 Tax=Phreatobacter cathodiphilus TaxID=1868589 RepID=A0A2S0N8I6_9HYPH|nr:hemin uptake protein HemP [Phreatobacter cathodiphilus]
MVADGATTVPVVEVGSILGAGREAVILHKGERYRLRVTANDKLILTK